MAACCRILLVAALPFIVTPCVHAQDAIPASACEQVLSLPISNITFCALDTETTGYSTRSDRILEIGMVRFQNGAFLTSSAFLINPGISIPPVAQRVNGITDEMVRTNPAFCVVSRQLLKELSNTVILAHNARFDKGFLNEEFHRCGILFQPVPVLDTLQFCRAWYPSLQHHNLEFVVRHLGLAQGTPEAAQPRSPEVRTDFHSALGDAQFLASIFMHGISNIPPDTTLGQLIEKAGGSKKILSELSPHAPPHRVPH